MKYSIVTRIYTEILINQAVDNFTSSRFRESRIDTKNYIEECKKEYLNNALYRAVRPYVDKLIDDLTELKQNDVKIRDFDILDYAKKGYRCLPSNEVCFLEENNIDKLVKRYFEKAAV